MDIKAEDLSDVIKKIVAQQIKANSNNMAFLYSGTVKSTSGGRFDVEIPSNGGIYTGLLNQTGTSLVVGDSVIVMMKGNKAGNSYITAKCGATIDGA